MAAALFLGCDVAYADDGPDADEIAEPDASAETSPLADAQAWLSDSFSSSSSSSAHVPSWSTYLLGDVLIFAGFDAWRYGGSFYVGADWEPPAQRGFVLRAFASSGLDDFKSRFETYRSATARASLLPGLHVQAGRLDLKVFAGLDYMIRLPLMPVLDMPIQMYGARLAADMWWEPAPRWMIAGSASATTIEAGLSARLATGWRLPFGWVGPEVLAIHDVFNTQLRAGGHLTGLTFDYVEWSMAGGYSQDSFGRSGPYGRIGFTLRH